MNKTKSGAISCGFGLSKARYKSEIEFFLAENTDGDLHGLLQTDEGKKLGRSFTISIGGGNDPKRTQVDRYCHLYRHEFNYFLKGFKSAVFQI